LSKDTSMRTKKQWRGWLKHRIDLKLKCNRRLD
jgi:hypothetical protein